MAGPYPENMSANGQNVPTYYALLHKNRYFVGNTREMKKLNVSATQNNLLQEKNAPTGSLLQQLHDREDEQSALLNVSNNIAAARRREDLLEVINDQVLALFASKYYTICLINEDGVTHSPFLHSREDTLAKKADDGPIVHSRHPINDGIFNIALASDVPVVLNLARLMEQAHAPVYLARWYKINIREMVVVKITNGNVARGVLYLYAEKENTFENCKSGLLRGIAAQVGTGICNVLANEKIEQQLEEIKRYKLQLEEENLYLQQENKVLGRFSGIIGDGKGIQGIYRLVSQVAPSDATALLLGETGTGKELVARAIHDASPRKNKLMIKVNCAAIPATLIESELFGHEKGSFTGATGKRLGKFELANNSTLFLDEIGEMPLEMQSKLLRVLQEKEIERLGGNGVIKTNVRVIAATNRNLEAEVRAGRFRADLYYRLNVFPITIPPLRDRKEDIPALAAYFVSRYARSTGKTIEGVAANVMESMKAYSWPGNVRELEHLIERAVVITQGNIIRKLDLPAEVVSQPGSAGMQVIKSLEEMERDHILAVVLHCKGRISGTDGAAVQLGIPASTLTAKMQKLGIKKEHFAHKM